jgi:hypothetical protein
VIFLLLLFTRPALAADSAWHLVDGTYATFQAPPGMTCTTQAPKIGGIEIFDGPSFSVAFECGASTLPRELQADFAKALGYWSEARRKDWKVNTYLEDDQHLAYAAIRTTADSIFRDPRPYHLSFGFAAGENPFSIQFRFQHPEDVAAIDRLLQSLKLKITQPATQPAK